MARVFTTSIPDYQCIGDSLGPINTNYLNLDEGLQNLDTKIAQASSSLTNTLSALNVTDSTTVDLTWVNSTRTLSADVRSNSITTNFIAASAVTAEKMSGGQTGSAPIYGCRAWVNFDATRNASGGSDILNTDRFIRASGNISRVEKRANGVFTIYFAINMIDTNYCATMTANLGSYGDGGCFLRWETGAGTPAIGDTVPTLSSATFMSRDRTGGLYNSTHNCIMVFR